MEAEKLGQNVANGYSQEAQVTKDEDHVAATNERREIQFKASHALLIAFFLWILYVSSWMCSRFH